MTDGIARRRFLPRLTCALGVTATGRPLTWHTQDVMLAVEGG
jgi:hypothetical protein